MCVGWVDDNPFTSWTVRKKDVSGITYYAAEVHWLLRRLKGVGLVISLLSIFSVTHCLLLVLEICWHWYEELFMFLSTFERMKILFLLCSFTLTVETTNMLEI